MAHVDDDMDNDTKDQNFMAEMVEVKVKMYMCRICGIRYDNMDSMKSHYNDEHQTAAEEEETKLPEIKEEIMDDEMHEITLENDDGNPAKYLILGEDGQPLSLDNIEVLQLAENDGQIVYRVINQEDGTDGQLNENDQDNAMAIIDGDPNILSNDFGNDMQQQQIIKSEIIDSTLLLNPPSKRGRKRKNPLAETTKSPITTLASTRSKRMVVPNIKSEFIYEGLSQSIETPVTTSTNNKRSRQTISPTYRFVREGDVITAFQVQSEELDEVDRAIDDEESLIRGEQESLSAAAAAETTEVNNENNDDNNNENVNNVENDNNNENENNNNDDDDEEYYPEAYTPTSKVKKGRVVEPKFDDSHLRKFPCPFQGCKYVAKYRSNLWDHKKTHTGEKPYACNWPSCSMRFSQTHQLKLHVRSHTGERPYVCDWPGCNSAFSQKPGLKSHMLTHTGEKPFKCDYPGCGWTFRLKGALTDHKRAIHENAKKHVCEWPGCNKRFLQQCHLKKHIMGHADIKPFACDWPSCNYRAVTMAYVTNHRKTHTGEKNYECTYPNCNKRFVKSSHVNRHRLRCHPDLFIGGDENEQYDDDTNDDYVEDDDNNNNNNNTANSNKHTIIILPPNNIEDDDERSRSLIIQQENGGGDSSENIDDNNENNDENQQQENNVDHDHQSTFQQKLLQMKQEHIDDDDDDNDVFHDANDNNNNDDDNNHHQDDANNENEDANAEDGGGNGIVMESDTTIEMTKTNEKSLKNDKRSKEPPISNNKSKALRNSPVRKTRSSTMPTMVTRMTTRSRGK